MKHRNQNKPSPFPGQMSQEMTKSGFNFFVFIVCYSTFLLIDECVLLSCFVYSIPTKRLAWGMSPKCPILCRVGCKTLTSNQ